jgi:hypothetical protein
MDDITAAREAIAALTRAYDVAVDAIDRVADRREAFTIATDLGEKVAKLRVRTGGLRKQIARRIYADEDGMSLAKLGEALKITRGRAQDLVGPLGKGNT